MLDEFCGASLDANDDPTWEQAIKGNDSQQWWDSGYEELANLDRFDVIDPIAADAIGDDEDIYDTMAVCKIKRGADNVKTRVKTRFVLCGNQMNKSAKRVEMRTMSPTIRSATFKSCCAVAAIEGMRHSAFDVVAAYLQGEFNGQRVVARAPRGFRTFDERGVEIVWILKRPLYGEPDAGRIWYNTFVHYVTVTDACRFQRCHYDPCAFVHKCSSESGGGRIILTLYVDDGRTFDSNVGECDAFLLRLAEHFAIKPDGLEFYLGMEISIPSPHVCILTSRTFIASLCTRCLPKPLESYPAVHTPGHLKLLDYYEAALASRDVPRSQDLLTRYRSIVGGGLWPAPNTRPDVLYEFGVLARAFTFPTEDLFNCAVRAVVYLGQHPSYGIRFTGLADNAHVLTAYSDSDWSISRSVTGGCLQLAGGNIWSMSKRQDCVAGSSTHAEIVAASTVANEVVWAAGLLDELGLEQLEPVVIYMDNSAVYNLSRDFASSSKSRHIERRHFIVRAYQHSRHVETRKIPTANNWADLFTKLHTRIPFEKFTRAIMNLVRLSPVPLQRPLYGVRDAPRMWSE